MTMSEITSRIVSELAFKPNEPQLSLISALAAFVSSRSPRDTFLLNGYAGTGKTSVVGALVRAMDSSGLKTVILAPTGRAAKVAANLAGCKASTIHKRIFRGNSADPSNTQFFLTENRDTDTLFIIDEASLVTDSNLPQQSLLIQLVRHVYSSPGCGILFVGDTAQLPPVGMDRSPAMNADRLRELGLNTLSFTLDRPVRQAAGSGILANATVTRFALFNGIPTNDFILEASQFPDVETVSSSSLADMLSESWSEVGQDETLIVTRSNKRANNFNRAIRNLVMYAEEPLQQGDRLVIAKNDYFWSKANNLQNFIANGETAQVLWVGRTEKAYGRYFSDVELALPGVGAPVAAKIMLRSLASDGPAIPREEMEKLYNRVLAEYDGSISQKIKSAMADPYLNALQVKYAYCVTCHKAQGGQWKHVYIDMGAIQPEVPGPEFYRWLYTAITRATEKLFFINPTITVS